MGSPIGVGDNLERAKAATGRRTPKRSYAINHFLWSRPEVNRRKFLSTALAAGALVAAEGPLGSLARAGTVETSREGIYGLTPRALVEAPRFAPVKVARNRIIRTIVGLRPLSR